MYGEWVSGMSLTGKFYTTQAHAFNTVPGHFENHLYAVWQVARIVVGMSKMVFMKITRLRLLSASSG